MSGAPLQLRVGINTGEALVRLGIAPGSGEGFLAGDAINTASRLLALGRPAESTGALHRARGLFVRCGMRPALSETEALLARATPLSS